MSDIACITETDNGNFRAPRKRARRRLPEQRTCPHCGGEFHVIAGSNQVYCCAEHRVAAFEAKRKATASSSAQHQFGDLRIVVWSGGKAIGTAVTSVNVRDVEAARDRVLGVFSDVVAEVCG